MTGTPTDVPDPRKMKEKDMAELWIKSQHHRSRPFIIGFQIAFQISFAKCYYISQSQT